MAKGIIKLMILEDEASHAEAIRRVLAVAGMDAEIQAAGTLREYRARVAARAPDIALADLNLPDGRAFEILTSPPERGPFPVLVMTSYGNEQTAVEAMKAGALDYVVKSPESFAAVPQILERALREWNLLQERKRAGEDIRALLAHVQEEKTKLAVLIDSIIDEVWFADSQGRFTLMNPSALREFGINPGETKEVRKLTESLGVFRPDGSSRPVEEAPPLRALLGEVVRNQEEIIFTPASGGLRYRQVSSTPVRNPGGSIIGSVSVVRDITERKRAEEKALEMERRLLHSQKLESLGVLAGGIAHDFNNLLTAILGNLDLALYDLSPVSPARVSVEEAIHATRRAEALTRQMLAYSGKGRFIIADMDLSELVEENAHMLRAALSKSVKLNRSMDKGLPPISADAGQIQQVVMNLITNASESLGEQAGIVALSTGAMDCDDAYLCRSRLEEKPVPGRFVWLEVTDTGCGMDEETKERIFDPFFTTKFTGRGLGMSAVLGIVRGHQGAIIVESKVGKGTTIRILFPVSKASPVERDPGEKAAKGRIRDAGALPSSGTVLIVDDEECVRMPCAAMVEHAGYRALTAANGDEAVALFRGHADEVVCVILDLTMPGMDGVTTFEALRKIKPDVRVILSSGYNEQEATQRFSGQGPTGFIKKPYEMETLLAELERVMKMQAV